MKLKLNLFFKELLFFAIAQGVGIYVALSLSPELASNIGGVDLSKINFSFLFVLIFLVLIFSLLLRKKAIFYKVFLVLVIFFGVQTVLSTFLSLTNSYILTLAFILMLFTFSSLFLRNTAIALSLAGIGGVLGLSITPLFAVLLLVGFSFYDIIAVYKTKHMIKMAEGMIKSNAVYGIIVTSKKPKEYMILGSGDILMPLLLSASLASISLVSSLFVSSFAAIGLLLTHILFANQKTRKPMAALPPIATLSVIGYLISILI